MGGQRRGNGLDVFSIWRSRRQKGIAPTSAPEDSPLSGSGPKDIH